MLRHAFPQYVPSLEVCYLYIYIYQSTPNTSLLLSEAVLFTHPSNPIHVPSALLGVLHDNQV